MSLIEVEDLRKTFAVAVRRQGRFGAIKTLLAREYQQMNAVDGVSFRVEAGEMIGYIGPNAAGKSTTIKMLTGILLPSSEQIVVGWACAAPAACRPCPADRRGLRPAHPALVGSADDRIVRAA